MTYAEYEQVEGFLANYPVDEIPKAKIILDPKLEFLKTFNAKGQPVSYIYKKEMRLKKSIGKTSSL